MKKTWDILLVDDEPDVHEVTNLALKRKRWRKRSINLVSAHSRAEAEQIIAEHPRPFNMGFIDVVMESDDAGLELCKYIRESCPASFRIVLRTGQPGLAPEEFVLNEYDIDYYLAKGDATPERLYSVMRACLRSSEDIALLMAYSGQLQDFTRALASATAMEDLLAHMGAALGFLEFKHNLNCSFLCDAARVDDPAAAIANEAVGVDVARLAELAAELAPTASEAPLRIHPGTEHGLSEVNYVIPFRVTEPGQVTAKARPSAEGGEPVAEPGPAAQVGPDGEPVLIAAEPEDPGVAGALCVAFKKKAPEEKELTDLFADARLFLENWRIAHGTLRLQKRLAEETARRAKGELKKAVMEKELEVASAVQTSFVPGHEVVTTGGMTLAGYYRPASQCGGDWWSYHELADDRLLVMIGDVTGHGVAPAMITATAKGAATTLVAVSEGRPTLGGLMGGINHAIFEAARGKFMMTTFAVIYDRKTRVLQYANAGHNFPYVITGRKLKALVCRGRRLGETPTPEYDERELEIEPESLFVLFTDGITEMQNAAGDEVGDGQFRRWLKKRETSDPAALRDVLVEKADAFAGGVPQGDDITLVVGRFD